MFGMSPLQPSEQLKHIKGVVVRQGVGQDGDEQVQEYLARAKVKLPTRSTVVMDFDSSSDDDDDMMVPLTEEEILEKRRKYTDSLCFGGCW